MTPQEAAAKLNGSVYGEEGSPQLFEEMRAAGLVAVFGALDDRMEFRGAAYGEIRCWDVGVAYFTPSGLLQNECGDSDCRYHAREREKAAAVESIWGQDDISWQYKTSIPHATFEVLEDGAIYCRGIVFALADVPRPAS